MTEKRPKLPKDFHVLVGSWGVRKLRHVEAQHVKVLLMS